MAAQATPPVPPEEEADSSADEKKKKAPKPKFGQILNLGSGKMWTVESSEGGSVTIVQRDGDRMTRRNITEDEYAAAKENPLPGEYLRSKPPKGLTIGSYVDAGRVVGYDAATGEAQIEGPKGTVWASGKTLFGGGTASLNKETSERGAGGPADIRSQRSQGASVEPSSGIIHRAVSGFVAKNVKDLTGGLVDLSKQKSATSTETSAPASASPIVPSAPISSPAPSRQIDEGIFADQIDHKVEEIDEEAALVAPKVVPAEPSVVVSRIIPVGAAAIIPSVVAAAKPTAASSVSVSKIITVGGGAAVPEAAGTVSVEIPQPSIRETREQMRGAMKSVGARFIAPAPAPAPAPSAVRGGDQQQLYARAADALQIMGSRVASQRAAIQDLQGEATALRDEIAGLNAQPTAGSAQKIQIASKKLGDTNNRIALSRFNLQADEARVQQLQIGTNLMRNAAPEVAAGRMPAVVVSMVEQSIPGDIPRPSPARAAALIASMSGAPSLEPPPQHEEGAGGGGSPGAGGGAAPRSYATTPPTVFARSQPPARAGVSKRPTLPVTAAAFLSAQQADRGTGYVPGAGSPDARQAALGSAGAASGLPVISTKPKSYAADTDLTEAEQAQDIFNAGAGGPSSEFAKKQQQSQETLEQFLPEPTPGLEAPMFEKEADRPQSVRGDDLRAAAYNAARQRTRAATLSTMLSEDEEATGAASTLKGLKQAESVRRNVARMFDLVNAAMAIATIETIIGTIGEIVELLASMNGRVLSLMFFRNPKSLARKVFPPAQFPYEVAAIVTMDFIIFSFLFLSLCLTLLPFLIIAALMALGIGGFAFVVAGS